jgi:spermidine synthase
MAGKVDELGKFREDDAMQRPFETRYYNAEIHRAALAMPTFLQQHLGK